MFEKAKLRKKEKALGKVIERIDAYWFYTCGSTFGLDAMNQKDIKAFGNEDDLIDRIRNCRIYKDIKALRKKGDEPAAEYIRYYEEKVAIGQYPNEFGGYDQFKDYKGNPKELTGYYKERLVMAILFALKADAAFWIDQDGSSATIKNPYPTLKKITRELGNVDNILTWPMNADFKCFINGHSGVSGYREFFRALLKAYQAHGQSPLWNETMKRLAYPHVYYEEDKDYYAACSVLCARFPDVNQELDKHVCLWYSSSSYGLNSPNMYGKLLMPYASFIEKKVEQYILFNEEYWSGSKFQEIWDYYGKLNEDAWVEVREYRKREREKEELPDLEDSD